MPPKTERILVIDDDRGLRSQLRWALNGYDVVEAGDRKSALSKLHDARPAVVLLDLGLPPDADGPSEGFSTLTGILTAMPDTKLIVMTGQADRAYAAQAIGLGAFDYYQKPLEFETLNHTIERAFRVRTLEQENSRLTAERTQSPLPGFVATDPEMLRICEQLRRFAGSDVSVLLVGESGTGKEILARALHQLSPRGKGPYIAVNCAAIPEHLLESELFGHEKGAFTGAIATNVGKVEMADNGTFLLDEIGDLPLALQAKLLRFLQERTIERIGGRRQIAVDIRVIAATNQDPKALIKEGRFREDLFYRLSEIEVTIPPLRDRPEDILAIARHLIGAANKKHGRKVRGLTRDAFAALSAYDWPGNVRELENRINRAVVATTGREVTALDLDLTAAPENGALLTLREARDQAERRALNAALMQADGNISKAARLLDTSRPTLYQLLKAHGIKLDGREASE